MNKTILFDRERVINQGSDDSMQSKSELIAIAYDDPALALQAQDLANQWNLPLNNEASEQLLLTKNGLMLKFGSFLPLHCDFNIRTWQKRRDAGKQQGLIRACKPTKGMKIIDATAGWGRDAALLASFGAEVLMLERQNFMAALLHDALQRRDERSQEVMNLTLKQVNAIIYLDQLRKAECPDLIYLDPMHPIRQKNALVKKDLQVLQQLIGVDNDALTLLELALKKAKHKVVVKWPQQMTALIPPTQSISGKTVRFDLYI